MEDQFIEINDEQLLITVGKDLYLLEDFILYKLEKQILTVLDKKPLTNDFLHIK